MLLPQTGQGATTGGPYTARISASPISLDGRRDDAGDALGVWLVGPREPVSCRPLGVLGAFTGVHRRSRRCSHPTCVPRELGAYGSELQPWAFVIILLQARAPVLALRWATGWRV
jgi:hypothetical protein